MATYFWTTVKRFEVATYPTAAATTPTWVHVPSIEQAQMGASSTQNRVYGDDVLQYTYSHSLEAQLNVTLTKANTQVMAMVTGNSVITGTDIESLYLMTQHDLQSPYLLGRVTVPTKLDDSGLTVDLRLILFKIQVRPIWDGFGAARTQNTNLNWVFDVMGAYQDELGDPLPVGIDYASGRYDLPTSV